MPSPAGHPTGGAFSFFGGMAVPAAAGAVPGAAAGPPLADGPQGQDHGQKDEPQQHSVRPAHRKAPATV